MEENVKVIRVISLLYHFCQSIGKKKYGKIGKILPTTKKQHGNQKYGSVSL